MHAGKRKRATDPQPRLALAGILWAANWPANCLSTDTQRWRAHHTDPRTNFNEDERIFFLLFLLFPSIFATPWHSVGNQELATTSPTGSFESRRHLKFTPDDPPSFYSLLSKQRSAWRRSLVVIDGLCALRVARTPTAHQKIKETFGPRLKLHISCTWQPADKLSLRLRTVLFLNQSVKRVLQNVLMTSQVVSTPSAKLTPLHEKWRPTCKFSGGTQTTLPACYFWHDGEGFLCLQLCKLCNWLLNLSM